MNKIIFDMDGTLIDSMHKWRRLIRDYMDSLEVAPDDAFSDDLKSLSLKESIRAIHENFNIDKTTDDGMKFIHMLMQNAYRNDFDLKPGVRKALQKLDNMGVEMMIATATPDELVEVALDAQGIGHYFKHIQTCKNTGLSKSDPKYWERALEKIGGTKEDTAIFEDALYCVETVKDMGLYTVVIEDKSARQERKELKEHADQYIRHYRELDYSVFRPE